MSVPEVQMYPLEKRTLLDVIRLYKDYPCLWDKTHPHYLNKEVRTSAYEALLQKYSTAFQGARVRDMKRKLDSLRTTYKRETKKVAESKARGDNPCYISKLWYYDEFSFLQFHNPSDIIISSVGGAGHHGNKENSYQLTSRIPQADSNGQYDNNAECYNKHEQDCQIEYYGRDVEEELKTSYVDKDNKKQKIEIHVNDHGCMKSAAASSKVDESEAYGRTVGLQLQQLDPFQRTVAEKLISEVIFYARLNKLSANTMFNLNADSTVGQ